ncbi:hypothetical protein COI93_02270 [Bacillus cereus]|uniref:AAA domain-containing protein n=1 Tax=Bacillus cereus TaxID=1396 RepID=A0A2B0N1Z9_BACCE|nr:hypothetical protein COI93_02270 [Bacillus cereus]
MEKLLKLLIVANDGEIASGFHKKFENEEIQVQHILHASVRTELSRYNPDIIILVQQHSKGVSYHTNLVSQIREVVPNVHLIFICETREYDLLKEMIRLDVHDYYQIPGEEGLIAKVIDQLTKKQRLIQDAEVTKTFLQKERGKVIAFFSGKGGSGKTLLSTNFAQTLKFESTADVLFIDLNLQYGGAESFLGMQQNRAVTDLDAVINELNEQHIRNIVQIEEKSGLNVLLSPCDAEKEEWLAEDFTSKLLRVCRKSYDFVVVDLPSNMNVHTFAALAEADTIYYILTLDTPSIKMYKRVEELLQRLGLQIEDRVKFVTNGMGRDRELNVQDVKNILPSKSIVEVRRDFKGVQAAINQEQPLRQSESKKRLLPIAKDIRKWVLASIN